MTFFAAIVFALLAGITEILPMSGTGLLIVSAKVFGVPTSGAAFQSFRGILYLGVAFGALLYYHTQIWDIVRERLVLLGIARPVGRKRTVPFGRRLWSLLLCATLPMIPALLLNGLRTRIEQGALYLVWISLFFCISGTVLFFLTRGARGGRGIHQTDLSDVVSAGLFQVFSILPGASRAGLTMTALLSQGIDGPAAMEFSGLMGVPVFAAAGVINLISASGYEGAPCDATFMVLGFALSALAAFFTIRILTEWISCHRLTCFAYWTWGAAILTMSLFLISA